MKGEVELIYLDGLLKLGMFTVIFVILFSYIHCHCWEKNKNQIS